MASLINVRLNRGDASPWGFRLQGGKDFGTPLVIQKVNGSSLAENAGLQVGDAVIKVNGHEVFNLRHKDAQDIIVRSGNNIEITIQRGGAATWKPAVQTVGGGVTATPHMPSKVSPVTKTSLAASKPSGNTSIGSSHNLSPRPFNQVNGEPVKSIVNKQYNSPVNIYSEQTIAETLSAQAEVLAGGVLGVNFKKNERGYDAEKSEVYKMLQEAEREPKTPEPAEVDLGGVVVPPPVVGLRHVAAPENKPPSTNPSMAGTGGQNICSECERLIVGVFVRIKDKNLHVECFKCATCGSSLKNIGYYSINNKLYCDIHAKLVARSNPPAPNVDPITIPPSSGFPAPSAVAPLSPSVAPQSPQSNLAPLPFHSPRMAPSHVAAPRPVPKSSPSANIVPKPFSSVQPPSAPYQPPAAPAPPAPAPPSAAPFYNKPQSAENNNFARPPNQQDGSDTVPAAAATPLSITHPTSLPLSNNGAGGNLEQVTPIEEIPCCLNKNKRMSICSEEVCKLSEEEKTKLMKGECLLMLKEESERPESPVPFPKSGSNSTVTTPMQEEMKSFGLAVSNMNIEEKKEGNTVRKTLVSEDLESRGMEGTSTSQKVEKSEENGVQRTRTIKTEESFSHSSSSFSSVRASQSTRCITPEICEIMEKPFGSPSLLPRSMDRPATPQQVISFPPEVPEFLSQPKSRTGTPQPQPLKRILTEEFGVSVQPSLPKQEVAELFQVTGSNDDGKMVKIEELYTKSQVEEIVKKELTKYKTGTEINNSLTTRENEQKQIRIQQQQQEIQQQLQFQQEQQRHEQLQWQKEQQRQEQQQQEQQRQEQLKCQQEQQRQEQLQWQQEQQIQQQLQHEQEQQRQEQLQCQQEQQRQEQLQEQQRQEQLKHQQGRQRQEQLQRQQEQLQLQQQREEQQIHFHQQQQGTQQFHQKQYQQSQISQESESHTSKEVQSLLYQNSDRSFSPVHAPSKIVHPKPQMIPLPPETKPYQPPPPPPQMSEEEQHAQMLEYRKMACQSPLVAALTVAPSRSFTPTTFQPIPTLDDLPKPPAGEGMSLLSALTIAPEEPFNSFPKPVDVSRISPPKFQKWQQKSAVSQELSQQSVIQKHEQATSSMQQSQTIYCQKSTTCDKPSIVCDRQVSKPTENSSAFKPMFKPQPLPLPEPVIKQATVPKYLPPVTDGLKSNSMKPNMQSFPPKSQVDTRSISPSGLNKPAILPYYQQSMGENTLQNRSRSPVQHKASTTDSSKSQFCQRSSSVAGNIISSNNARARSFISSSTGYVSSSVYGQTFTCDKDEPSQRPRSTTFGEASDNFLPYYQQNIGEIPLAHRPKSPVPHPIKAPSISTPARASPIMNKPSPLAGKAPETLSKSKQVFKPEVKPYNNVFATPTEPLKPLNKTLPHFTKPKSAEETSQKTPGVPWVMKKVEELSSSSVTENKKGEKTSLSSLLRSTMPLPAPSLSSPGTHVTPSKAPDSQKSAAGFTPPKPLGSPTTSVPPTGAGGSSGGPGNKGATFAGSTAPRRGRGTLNPSVAPGGRVPLCGSCNSHIRGPFITALGKIWCPEHFVCANGQCRRPLQDVGFVEESSGLYCEFCFEQFLAPSCNKCSRKIKGDCLNAIGKHFHPECFCCAYCGKLFGNSPFFLEDALPYCENDWNELFTTKCFSCGFPIEAGDRWVEALANNYHSQCFNCTMCKKNLEGQSFFAKGGRPFCKNHAR